MTVQQMLLNLNGRRKGRRHLVVSLVRKAWRWGALVKQVACNFHTIIVSRVQSVEHARQLGYHAAQFIVLLVFLPVLYMIPTKYLCTQKS